MAKAVPKAAPKPPPKKGLPQQYASYSNIRVVLRHFGGELATEQRGSKELNVCPWSKLEGAGHSTWRAGKHLRPSRLHPRDLVDHLAKDHGSDPAQREQAEAMIKGQAVGAAWEPGIPHEVQLMPDTTVVQYIRQKILEQQEGYVRKWWEEKALPAAVAHVMRARLMTQSLPPVMPGGLAGPFAVAQAGSRALALPAGVHPSGTHGASSSATSSGARGSAAVSSTGGTGASRGATRSGAARSTAVSRGARPAKTSSGGGRQRSASGRAEGSSRLPPAPSAGGPPPSGEPDTAGDPDPTALP